MHATWTASSLPLSIQSKVIAVPLVVPCKWRQASKHARPQQVHNWQHAPAETGTSQLNRIWRKTFFNNSGAYHEIHRMQILPQQFVKIRIKSFEELFMNVSYLFRLPSTSCGFLPSVLPNHAPCPRGRLSRLTWRIIGNIMRRSIIYTIYTPLSGYGRSNRLYISSR